MICKTFDHPLRILFWSADEFFILALFCFLGLLLKSLILLVLAWVLQRGLAHVKKSQQHQALSHYMYAYFPTHVCQKANYFLGLPPSHLKELLLN